MTSDPYDLAVIGAGSAGLAGAVAAGEQGLSVALLDAAAHVGGQLYRGRVTDRAYTGLRRRLTADHLPGHHVWAVTRDAGLWTVHAVTGDDGASGEPVRIRARAVLLATGAYERHLPFPGWTLPGVVGAGGAQAMLKSGGALPGRRIVVAGSGPLLLAVAGTLASAGARVPALVEAASYVPYARHPRALGKAGEGLRHGAALIRHRVRPLTRSAVTEAHGTDRVTAVTVARLDATWRPVPGTERRIPCDALAVGHGLVPQTDLAVTLGAGTRTLADGTSALVVDETQETTVAGLWTAGETSGVGGGPLARTEGELAGLAVAARLLARPADPRRVRTLRRRRDRLRAFAATMTAVHAPGPGWPHWLTDDTDVCRCEEVTAGRIREAGTDLGARDARTVKLLTRAGMGWCQGRMCGPAVSCLVKQPHTDRRPLAAPVPLGALAALVTTPDTGKAPPP
ncbi:Hydrogen cyanide synthase subunit HcnB [Streptomyces sp. RB5]|uniref:Hydrogen cyanide synthase subunit HcnB n=1 Tax=Streptomyces smaragdinus TaxID=2585196 RepID=A0A7K0CHN8_9ACTN|nr:NAD(P)/FAD-dependent oxidoreductase [Streptomyces smaragdinus]MQY12823.1 Hydrogen cyanide synthase subunit HcnB [Streptomyces smaragdinus]